MLKFQANQTRKVSLLPLKQSFLICIMAVLSDKLENKHDSLCKIYTLKYVSTETDAKHEPLGLKIHCLLMHMQYICSSQHLTYV
jgi:hypothetical protein